MKSKDRATQTVRRRYDRFAPLYDCIIRPFERGRLNQWRSLLWQKVEGKEILEVGVGTGHNLPYADTTNRNITAIDLSEGMLMRARQRAARASLRVRLLQMDVQNLQFQDNTFDTVVGSLLFCSVPDPLLGLTEIKRVCKFNGKVVLLEHGLSENKELARFMNLLDPFVAWITGAEHINRKIEDSVGQSGLQLEKVTRLDRTGIFKLVEARKI